MELLKYNLSCLRTKSVDLKGPLAPLYLRDLISYCSELKGVCLAGIQVLDKRNFFVSNPLYKSFPPIVYNPQIISLDDPIKEKEGCLSFPGMWITVLSYKYVTLKYRDSNWKEITASFGAEDRDSEEGLLAKAIIHEVGHLNGETLIDRATNEKMKIKHISKVLQLSMEQNKRYGVPKLIEGPPEVETCG